MTIKTSKGKCQTCATLWNDLTIARLAQDGPFGGYGMVTDLDAQERTVSARHALRSHMTVCEQRSASIAKAGK